MLTRRRWLQLTLAAAACSKGSRPADDDAAPQPGKSPQLEPLAATFEVTSTRALLWARAPAAGPAQIELDDRHHRVQLAAESDYTIAVDAGDLKPDSAHRWRLVPTSGQPSAWCEFRTAPAVQDDVPVAFVVGADISDLPGYASPLLETMAGSGASFFVCLGDFPYADLPRPGARTLAEYRARHFQVRTMPVVRHLLQRLPTYAIYDDHEVVNDWDARTRSVAPDRVAAALRAWDEYFPLRIPDRRYRSWRWGRHLELFLLDTRMYRSDHLAPESPGKTMLGDTQRAWLAERLAASSATFKVVLSTVPFGLDTTGEAWPAYPHERAEILDLLAATPGAVVISGDQHWFAAHQYANGVREFQVGPLRANLRRPRPQRPPELLARVERPNYGELHITAGATPKLQFTARGASGEALYSDTLSP